LQVHRLDYQLTIKLTITQEELDLLVEMAEMTIQEMSLEDTDKYRAILNQLTEIRSRVRHFDHSSTLVYGDGCGND